MTDFTKEFLLHHDNQIWFYADIDVETCLHLNALLKKIDKEIAHHPEPIIHLHINSFGGSVLAALATIDTMRQLKCKVYTYVDGGAASAATLISCVASKRLIGEHSYMLIHQVRGESGGKLEEMEDEIINTRQFMQMIKGLYKKHTKLKDKKMDELLKSDLWIDAKTCLEYGLVDEII
jgi:ATP-dependent Clp endopeptidase proteolytic subunit ClpP